MVILFQIYLKEKNTCKADFVVLVAFVFNTLNSNNTKTINMNCYIYWMYMYK